MILPMYGSLPTASLLGMVGTNLTLVPGGRERVAVSVIGTLAVRVDGVPQPSTVLGSRKARTLLALLAVQRGRLVGLDRVVDVLWTGVPPKRPAQDTATLVSRLRAVLGSGAVVGGRPGYRLGDQVSVDLYDAAQLVNRAESCIDDDGASGALVAGRRALDLLEQGEVLGDQADAVGSLRLEPCIWSCAAGPEIARPPGRSGWRAGHEAD